MNNTLFYVLKWIYSQSSYHWYVRRFKYVWHKETVELTDGWFCWYRSWRGNLSTVNWQITETKETVNHVFSVISSKKKTHSSTGFTSCASHPICVKKRQTEQSEAVGSAHARVNLRTALRIQRPETLTRLFQRRSTCRKGRLGSSAETDMATNGGFLKKKLRPSF